ARRPARCTATADPLPLARARPWPTVTRSAPPTGEPRPSSQSPPSRIGRFALRVPASHRRSYVRPVRRGNEPGPSAGRTDGTIPADDAPDDETQTEPRTPGR